MPVDLQVLAGDADLDAVGFHGGQHQDGDDGAISCPQYGALTPTGSHYPHFTVRGRCENTIFPVCLIWEERFILDLNQAPAASLMARGAPAAACKQERELLPLGWQQWGAVDAAPFLLPTTIKSVAKHLLLFAATTGYQIRVFADAARRLGVDVTLATDRCHILDDPWGDRAIAVKFDQIEESLKALRGLRVDGVAAVGDRPAVLAAAAAEMLGVPFHPEAAARACHDKHVSRAAVSGGGNARARILSRQPADDPAELAARAPYPCVLKPLGLSASRGVIRANDAGEFVAAFRRIAKMGERELQVESYIPGREFAVEGLITGGKLQPIAIFDKPDPLEGPVLRGDDLRHALARAGGRCRRR